MSAEAREFFEKYVPRWIKVMRWRDYARQFIENQKIALVPIYFGGIVAYSHFMVPYHRALLIRKPQTEEERMKLKEQYNENYFSRNYEIDQYQGQVQPMFDVFKRRQKYPEYYGDKYNKYKMHNEW